jgi:hypothetical protein
MNRHLLVLLAALLMTPGAAAGQATGGYGGDLPPAPHARHEMMPPPAPGMMPPGPGMMGPGMMKGGTMASEPMGAMMPGMMSPMLEGMMPGKTRGCMMLAEGMMKGQVDVAQMRTTLALSEEQVERLRASQRPFQKETILTLAAMKVAELELADLVAADKPDFGKVEAKLKEIEGMRTKVRLAHLKAAAAVKAILSAEQLEKLQGIGEGAPPAGAPPGGAVPGRESEHGQHH